MVLFASFIIELYIMSVHHDAGFFKYKARRDLTDERGDISNTIHEFEAYISAAPAMMYEHSAI